VLAAGAIVGVAGVTPWLAFALRIDALYRPILKGAGYRAAFHPVAEVQGFLSLVAVSLLFAGVPRSTGAPEARGRECLLAAACGVGAAAAAWADRWDLAQTAWLALAAVAAGFAASRRRWLAGAVGAGARAWLAAALVAAVAGAALAVVGASDPRGALHDVGRALLWQGAFTAVAVAVSVRRSPSSAALHATGALLLLATFALDALVSRRAGFAARSAVALASVAAPALAELRSRAPARRLAGAALAALPVGYGWAAADPVHRRAGLHLVYLGCFTGLALLAWSARRAGGPASRAARWASGLLGVALAARLVLELDAPSFHLWLGVACAAFAAGVLTWAVAALRGAA
jgi:hypothetical protein